jgi:hypothetical protein
LVTEATLGSHALDLLYGPIYHRLQHGHAPLNDRFVRDVIDIALHGIAPVTSKSDATRTNQRGPLENYEPQLTSTDCHAPNTRVARPDGVPFIRWKTVSDTTGADVRTKSMER